MENPAQSMKIVPLLILVLALAACTAGRNFEAPTSETAKLGQTTLTQFISLYGKPEREGSKVVNGEQIKDVVYVFVATRGPVLFGAKVDGRSLAASFWQEKLVGYQFVSSFSSDSTAFNEARVNEIERGEWTSDDAIKAFGKPHGEMIYPLVEENGGRQLQYIFMGSMGLYNKPTQKVLSIEVDPKGIVSNFSLSTLGS